jgi:hypothetical protein
MLGLGRARATFAQRSSRREVKWLVGGSAPASLLNRVLVLFVIITVFEQRLLGLKPSMETMARVGTGAYSL